MQKRYEGMQTGISTAVKALPEVGGGVGVPIQPYLAAKQRLRFLGQNYIVAGKQKRTVSVISQRNVICVFTAQRGLSQAYTLNPAL